MIEQDLQKLKNPEKAKILQRFFKTGMGEYGEGDIFLGVMSPDQRAVVKKYKNISLGYIQELLNSKIHEYRGVALGILKNKYKGSENKEEIIKFYLKNTKNINNWDLVDCSASEILGDYLFDKDKKILYEFSKSNNLWERRIAIISCFNFIKKDEFEDVLKISEILLNDKHDLIHKAVGWMLREIGKRNLEKEENFLKKHYKKMPRTMLRYAIEKFSEEKRKFYLKRA